MSTETAPLSAVRVEPVVRRKPFPYGCTITNIKRGEGHRAKLVYAQLRGPDGELLISATLEYINQQIVESGTLPPNASVTALRLRSVRVDANVRGI